MNSFLESQWSPVDVELHDEPLRTPLIKEKTSIGLDVLSFKWTESCYQFLTYKMLLKSKSHFDLNSQSSYLVVLADAPLPVFFRDLRGQETHSLTHPLHAEWHTRPQKYHAICKIPTRIICKTGNKVYIISFFFVIMYMSLSHDAYK